MAPCNADTMDKKERRKSQIETVACFRTGGSLPVPRPLSKSFCGGPLPVVKRIKEPPPLQHAQQEEEQTSAYTCPELAITNADTWSTAAESLLQDHHYSSAVVTSAVVLECPIPKSEPQSCKKHTRCHCALLSLETPDFFAVKA